MIRFPLKRCIRLTLVLRSGHEVVQNVWSYDIKYGTGESVRSTSWVWAGEQRRAKLVAADEVAVVYEQPGPWCWRGWRA